MAPPRIAFLPGDGIGPEVVGVARRVLDAAGFQAQWVELPLGWQMWRTRGDALPPETLKGLRSCTAALKGPITSKPEDEAERDLDPKLQGKDLRYRSPIVRMRQELDLYTNLRPVRTLPGLEGIAKGVDLVIFRENTEDLYAGLEAWPFPKSVREAWAAADPGAPLPAAGGDTAVTVRVITRRATQRICRAAFTYAQRHGRKRVTLLEKANVLRATGSLVLEVFHDVAKEFPTLQADDLNIDAACALVLQRPDRFDVVVATNLFGDIFSDVAAEVAGGLPLAASGNIGDKMALFEPVHGSAPDLAGRAVANPLGAVLAGAMLARHVGQESVAERIEVAVHRLLRERRILPRDLGGAAATGDVERALTQAISAGPSA